MMKLQRRALAGALVAALALAGAACSDDDEEPAETGSAPEETTTTAPEEESEETTTTAPEDEEPAGDAVEVTGVDFAFEDLPESVPAGTQLTFTNAGTQPHELVALLIPESETRSIDELAALPDAEQAALFGAGEPATVIVAVPGGSVPGPVVGDGTLSDPGRYAIICTFPVGVTVEEIQNATGPLDPAGRPTHDDEGMYAELIVE